ncbi:hypothetical protein [Agrobacterium sp. CG674]
MTEIISFFAASRRFAKPANPQKATDGPAQILFFTGVRYERPVPQIQIEDARKPRKRKTIEATTEAATGS